jgi:hypothetical protein
MGGDAEALAVAAPTDAVSGGLPVELETMLAGALDVYDAGASEQWDRADTALDRMTSSWAAYQERGVPPLLESQMERALRALEGDHLAQAVAGRNAAGARRAALDAAVAVLDLQLRHRPVAEIDLERLRVWVRQLALDIAIGEPGPVAGDITVLEWIRDRIKSSLDPDDASQVDSVLEVLRTAADDEDVDAAADATGRLTEMLGGLAIVGASAAQ